MSTIINGIYIKAQFYHRHMKHVQITCKLLQAFRYSIFGKMVFMDPIARICTCECAGVEERQMFMIKY